MLINLTEKIMAERLNVSFTLKATDATDNSKFADIQLDWYDLPYADFVEFQGLLLNVGNQMEAWGKEYAKTKTGKGKGLAKG